MTRQHKAYLFAAVAVLFWSTVATAFKLTLRHVEPLQLVFLASLFSTLALCATVALQRNVRSFLRLSRKQLLQCALMGLLNPCLYYFVLFEAYARLPAQTALALNYSWPLMLVLLSIGLLHQRVRRLEFAAIGLAYAGVVIVATQGRPLGLGIADPLGVVLALASTLVWSLYWILTIKQAQQATTMLAVSFLFALPVLGLMTWLLAPLRQIDSSALAGAAYIGVFEMGVTYVVWSAALRHSATTARVGSLAYATPFLSLLVIHVVLGEDIAAVTLVGLLLIIGGIALQSAIGRRGGDPRGTDRSAGSGDTGR